MDSTSLYLLVSVYSIMGEYL